MSRRQPAILAVALIGLLVGCANEKADDDEPPSAAPCIDQGKPVSVAELARVFQDNGISLEANARSCSFDGSAEATNLGLSGLERNEAVTRREGDVFCSVDGKGGPEVHVVKYETDQETRIDALNVNCAIYPYDAASEERQVRQLKGAFEALVASTSKRTSG